MDAAEYKHVVLGLIFLKYISDAFEEKRAALEADRKSGADPEDPCCGSGGMFVQIEKFVEAHGGRIGDISIYGQESNPTTWRLAKMKLAIRGGANALYGLVELAEEVLRALRVARSALQMLALAITQHERRLVRGADGHLGTMTVPDHDWIRGRGEDDL